MNTNLNTKTAELAIIKFKRFVNAYETAKELFPELEHQLIMIFWCVELSELTTFEDGEGNNVTTSLEVRFHAPLITPPIDE